MEAENVQTNREFIFLNHRVFFWGFVGSANDILIPVFKKYLPYRRYNTVDLGILCCLFCWIYYFLFNIIKVDVLHKIWIQKTLSAGLVLSAIGSFMFVPAATMESFPFS
jgi:FHS family L-fucose permease-like MFS transporter